MSLSPKCKQSQYPAHNHEIMHVNGLVPVSILAGSQPFLALQWGSVPVFLHLNCQLCKEGLFLPDSHSRRLGSQRIINSLRHDASEHHSSGRPLGCKTPAASAHRALGNPSSTLSQGLCSQRAQCWHSCSARRCLCGPVMGPVACPIAAEDVEHVWSWGSLPAWLVATQIQTWPDRLTNSFVHWECQLPTACYFNWGSKERTLLLFCLNYNEIQY